MKNNIKNKNTVEIIPKRLYWKSSSTPPKNIENGFYFKIDKIIKYKTINGEFGPLNFSQILNFIKQLEEILNKNEYKKKTIFLLTSKNPKTKLNSALLISAFAIFKLKQSSLILIKKFSKIKPKFINYINAKIKPNKKSQKKKTPKPNKLDQTPKKNPLTTLNDCLRSLEYSNIMKITTLENFSPAEHKICQNFKKGYITPIIPNKLLISSSPFIKTPLENTLCPPEEFLKTLQNLEIQTIIRLNKKFYDKTIFEKSGMKFYDLYVPDHKKPHPSKIAKFIHIILNEKNKTVIHCDLGLEVSCLMVGMFLMQRFRMCAGDVVAFLRIMRPGAFCEGFGGVLRMKQNRFFAISNLGEFSEEQVKASFEFEKEKREGEYDVEKFINSIKDNSMF